MVYRLEQKGWEKRDVSAEVARLIENEYAAVNRFAGGALDDVPESWRLDLTYFTALRMLVEREGAFYYMGDKIVPPPPDREERTPRAEPVSSWYEPHDDLDDFEDLENEFG